MALLLAEGEKFIRQRGALAFAEQLAAAIGDRLHLKIVGWPAALQRRKARRLDEVSLLLRALHAGGSGGKTSDLALLPVVKALLASGFEKEARALAYSAVKNYSAR